MKKYVLIVFSILMITISCSAMDYPRLSESHPMYTGSEQSYREKLREYRLRAKIETDKGDIDLYLYPEAAPVTVASFVFLSEKGFYNNLTFHRVEKGFVIQGGDPLGNGTGGSGYTLPPEFKSFLNYDRSGMVGVARAQDPYSGSCQFFITQSAVPSLDGQYTIFASVANKKSMDVVSKIQIGDHIKKIIITGRDVKGFLDNFTNYTTKWEQAISR